MNGKWTKENFEKFHEDNPHVYMMFKRFAFEVAGKRPHFSATAIFSRMRWEMIFSTTGEFKIDDGWASHYARKFMKDYPQYNGFFRTRLRAESYHS